MVDLSQYTLLVIGRSAKFYGGEYYMNASHCELVEGMADQFRDSIYLCQRQDVSADVASKHVKIDQSKIHIRANQMWARTSSISKKYASLLSDLLFVMSLDHPIVTYTYYPGFYSFLLSPFVFHIGDANLAHFGSDAVDTAAAAYGNSLVDRTKGTLYRQFQSYVIKHVDGVFATDPRMVEQYDIETIRESKPLIEFTTSDIQEPQTTINAPITILSVGMFRPVKGYRYLIDSLTHLNEFSQYDYQLRLVGDGETRDDLKAQVAEKGLKNSVEFAGFIGDKEKLMRQYETADVFVIPSLKESVPRVLYEATAMGLPVVCTCVGGVPAFVHDERHVLLVEPEDSEELADAIDRLSNSHELREKLVHNAQKKIEWYLTGDPVSQRMELITTLLDDRQNNRQS